MNSAHHLPKATVITRGALLTLAVMSCGGSNALDPRHGGASESEKPVTREYFVAADEVVWDYAPAGMNLITGAAFDAQANVFVQQGPNRIGRPYLKSLYREYTDGTFATLKPRPAYWEHLGTLGPVIQAAVGDHIAVHFKNNTQWPASIHPHGVFYAKASEGAPYADGTRGTDTADDAVPPGGSVDYEWEVPERAGPARMDDSSVFWMYHSHTDEVADTSAGLIGPIIITARSWARSATDLRPRDVDRELVVMFTVFDENQSPYLDQNIQMFAGDPASVDPADPDFQESNLMHSINGYVYGNIPGLDMNLGSRVRWNLMGMGTEVDLHTPHWHGNVVTIMGMRTDVASLLSASMSVADMRPDALGTWLFHCHVNDHILAGMSGLYRAGRGVAPPAP